MSITIDQYRAQVGRFNCVTGCSSKNIVNLQLALSLSLCSGLPFWFILLILLSGDVHLNPGPKSDLITGFLLNTNSLKTIDKNRNKLAQFQTLVALKNPKIISLCETRLNNSILNNEVLPDDSYSIYRKDRTHRGGGGVLFAVHNSLKSKRRDDLLPHSNSVIDMVVVELSLKGLSKMVWITFYRSPSDNSVETVNFLHDTLKSIRAAGITNICLTGDLNLPNLDTNGGFPSDTNFRSHLYYDIFLEFGLEHKVHSPTHKAGNVLDLILTNIPEKFSRVYVEDDVFDSDHWVVNFSLNIKGCIKPRVPRKVFNYKKANWARFKQDIVSSDLNTLVEDDTLDLDSICQSWSDKILNLAKLHIPVIRIKISSSPPWVDEEVLNLSKRKETARRRAHKLDTIESWNKYNNLLKELKRLMNWKYKNYINNIADNVAEHPKRFWGLLKSKTKSRHIPDTIYYLDQKETQPKEKASLFNRFFASNFTQSDTGRSMPSVPLFQNDYLSNLTVSTDEVELALLNINTTKATGPDELSGTILKECARELAPSLTKIFNISLHTGQVPKQWKFANVTPIYKKGAKDQADNYRPISLLCITSKLLERCILNKIYNEIIPNISRLQHGFLRGRSTVTQLLLVLEQVVQNLDNNLQTDFIYLDFSKAFDSVPHHLLIHKLKSFGISGSLLAWFTDYLHDRFQRVVLEGETSDWLPVLSGVPQGSILGPFLFLLYINDMAQGISSSSTMALFADDAKVFRCIHSLDDCTALQDDLNSLMEWSDTWQLSFNKSKCKQLSFNSKPDTNTIVYTMGDTSLERVTNFNDLGIIVQNDLKWDEHINLKVSKANSLLGLVKRTLGYNAPTKAKLAYYNAIVKPVLSYGSVIWSYTSKQNLRNVESIQRRATKYILDDYTSNYKTRLMSLKLLPLSYTKEINDCCFIYKCLHHVYDLDIREILNFNDPAISRTRLGQQPFSLRTPLASNQAKDFFSRRAVAAWNSLPASLVTIIPVNKQIYPFKSRLKKIYQDHLEARFNPENVCTWRTSCGCGCGQ